MVEETEVVVETAPLPEPKVKAKSKAKAKAKAEPKAKVKAKTEPKVKVKAPEEASVNTDRETDVPWCDKKVAIFRAMKQLKATDSQSAASSSAIAARANVKGRDVRHYGYHAKAAGLVKLAEVEGISGYGFYLTAKGAAIDLVKVLKEAKSA